MRRCSALFTSALCCICVLTACGSNENSRSEEISVDKSEAPVAAVTDAVSEEVPGTEFEETFRKFFCSGDTIVLIEATLPDAVVEAMRNINAVDSIGGTMNDSVIQAMGGISEADSMTVEYISQRECNPEIEHKLESLYSSYYSFFKILEENEISYEDFLNGNVDENNGKLLSEAMDNMNRIGNGEDVNIETSVEFDDVRAVTLSLNGDQADFLFYKIGEESWKLDTIGLAVLEY